MRKSILALVTLCCLLTQSKCDSSQYIGEIDYGRPLVVAYPGIGPCDFSYDGRRFYIVNNGHITKVKPAFVDKSLRGITVEQLLYLLDGAYLYVNRLDNGDFTLTAKGRLDGGVIGVLIIMAAVTGAQIASNWMSTPPAYQYAPPQYPSGKIAQQDIPIIVHTEGARVELSLLDKLEQKIQQEPMIQKIPKVGTSLLDKLEQKLQKEPIVQKTCCVGVGLARPTILPTVPRAMPTAPQIPVVNPSLPIVRAVALPPVGNPKPGAKTVTV